MSFWKFILVLALIILLIPTNGNERFELYTVAQRTVADIGGFCRRNPDVCDKVTGAFDGIVDRLKATADSIEQMLHEAGISAGRDAYGEFRVYGNQGYYYRNDPGGDTTSSMASDTLTSQDKSPDWQGPERL